MLYSSGFKIHTYMSVTQLTGLQKRAEKFINRVVVYQKAPGETIRGHFIGFDKTSIDRAVIQLSNAADRMTIPLMYVVSFFEDGEEAKKEAKRSLL